MRSAIKVGVVPEFRGDHFFLSNYDVHEPFRWRAEYFTSGEQAFAYAKTFFALNKNTGQDFGKRILAAKTPGDAKKLGRTVNINLDEWDAQKIVYMREIVGAKFTHVPEYAGKLINTGAMMLVEGNNWGDDFWGRCLDKKTGQMVGYNMLGVILMEERGRWLSSRPHKPLDY